MRPRLSFTSFVSPFPRLHHRLHARPLVLPTLTRRLMSQVKSLAVLDETELQDGQMKEVVFEDGKVLLSRIGDKFHATSAFCTHYGAPLAKGVLTADGRVVCPWHGACFNVCTGDIEDAPAPMALHTFKTDVKEGKIWVTAQPNLTTKANLARQPRLLATGANASGKGVVIIGGGSGTFHAVESLREHGYSGPITILSKETYPPIDRTKLSKALITDPAKIEWRTPADLKIKYGTNIRLGAEVSSVDLTKKVVTLQEGKEEIPYEKLILATGGTPRRLPIDGAQLENVYTFRGIDDAKKVDAAAQEGKKLVVIGSSFIGLELVVALSKRKLASIDVIGMEEVPFQNVLGKEVGAAIQKFQEQAYGVKFHMGAKVDKIIPKEGDPKLAGAVVVNNQTLPADFVVMGVGVAPATQFLKESGLTLERDGAIKVDKFLRVISGPDQENVYAIGDIAIFPQVDGSEARIEHWNVAGNHGRAVGLNISGTAQPFVKIPVFWSAQGQQLRYCGLGAKFEDVYITGSLDELKFVAYYIRDNKVVAVASMQKDPIVTKASELLRLGLMPSVEEIRAGKDILSIDISTASVAEKIKLSGAS